jgi:hypothetical protein
LQIELELRTIQNRFNETDFGERGNLTNQKKGKRKDYKVIKRK